MIFKPINNQIEFVLKCLFEAKDSFPFISNAFASVQMRVIVPTR